MHGNCRSTDAHNGTTTHVYLEHLMLKLNSSSASFEALSILTVNALSWSLLKKNAH